MAKGLSHPWSVAFLPDGVMLITERAGQLRVVRNGVLAVTEEMKTNLMRTAYNMIIYEALDFTTGLFTAEGETVSIGIGCAPMRCFNVWPSRNSKAMKVCPSCSPMS